MAVAYANVYIPTCARNTPLPHPLTVLPGDGGQDSLQPAVSGLEELEAELCTGEDIHPPQKPDHTQTGRQLDGATQLLEELQ